MTLQEKKEAIYQSISETPNCRWEFVKGVPGKVCDSYSTPFYDKRVVLHLHLDKCALEIDGLVSWHRNDCISKLRYRLEEYTKDIEQKAEEIKIDDLYKMTQR